MSDARENFGKAVESIQSSVSRDDPEKDLWEGNFSAKGMVGPIVLNAVVSVAIFVAMIMVSWIHNNATVVWVLVSLILISWAYVLGLLFYRKFSNHYELTTQRLKHRDGILIRTMNRIELIDIDDVIYRQGPIESLLNVGNITIKSSDISHPILVLRGISDVKKIADEIDNARRLERRRRGLHIEAV